MFYIRKVAIIALIYLRAVRATLYDFILENDEVFDNCPELQGSKGISDIADLTEMTITYDEGHIQCSGNVTSKWQGVQPTDRIEAIGELYKFRQGSWQPTPISNAYKDFCTVQFDEDTLWYQFWTQYIDAADHKCFNNFGITYHHQPFQLDAKVNFVGNMEGRHKIVVRLNAYDEANVKRPKSICFQIFGELVKVK